MPKCWYWPTEHEGTVRMVQKMFLVASEAKFRGQCYVILINICIEMRILNWGFTSRIDWENKHLSGMNSLKGDRQSTRLWWFWRRRGRNWAKPSCRRTSQKNICKKFTKGPSPDLIFSIFSESIEHFVRIQIVQMISRSANHLAFRRHILELEICRKGGLNWCPSLISQNSFNFVYWVFFP